VLFQDSARADKNVINTTDPRLHQAGDDGDSNVLYFISPYLSNDY
jgi:hypothetical protein